MREFKFRFWGPFGEWEEPDEMVQKKAMLYGTEFVAEEDESVNDLFSSLDADDIVPMQFTGLKDKNGKDIYEGDIVRQGKILYIVSFGPFTDLAEAGCVGIRAYGWHYRGINMKETMGMLNDESGSPEESEVVGNIYENRDLLNGN